MINYPHRPEKLFAIKEIADRIQSGEYSAELLLMHLSCHYDKQNALLNNLTSVHIGAMERWKNESPIRVDFAGKIDGGDMTLNILSVELDKPYSVKGVKIGEKVTISRYFD